MIGTIAALAAMSVMAAPSIEDTGKPLNDIDHDFFLPGPHRGKGKNNRRGKGKRNPPKSRPNRLLIGKRVRRKHRRAA